MLENTEEIGLNIYFSILVDSVYLHTKIVTISKLSLQESLRPKRFVYVSLKK